jgi:serine/threonine protein kinase
MVMIERGRCLKCDTQVSTDSPEGLCPACLFRQAIESSNGEPEADQQSKSPAPAFVPPTPANLARYFPQLEILELLGQGGMGAVYKARQIKLDRLVAVKILPPEVARDTAFAERFMREARSLARLNHPHIVTVYDFGEVDGLFYFSMEFVDGKNVRQLLHAGKLSQDQALQIVPQVCEALRYAHDEGIVHRDIKPENILLDKKGRVKIADFGLAKLVGLTPTYLTLTGAHEVMGTLFYMAPEQTRRSHQVDHRADIYSLGVVFYEMLTGELPLGRFGPPSQKSAVDARLDAIVLRALAREPEHRYQDAGELKRDLEAIAPNHQPAAPPKPQPAPVPASAPSVRFSISRSSRKGKEYVGAIYCDEHELIVEYEEDGNLEDLEIKVVRIPFSGIAGVGTHWNWEKGYNELIITPTRLSVLSGLPTTRHGRGRFRIDWQECKAAKKFIDTVRARVSPEATPAADPQRLQMALSVPAVGLLLTGIIALVVNAILLTVFCLREGFDAGSAPKVVWALVMLSPATLAAAIVQIAGAVRMLQHRSYATAVASSLIAMIPWTPVWVVSLPLGIIALVLLRKLAVVELFIQRKGAPNGGEPAPLEPAAAQSWRVRSFLRSMAGYFVTSASRDREAEGPANR